jgi:hypothetical protein
MSADRSAGRDPDWTDEEAEGQPVIADQPPGIDSETASEGRFLPRTHPIAADEIGVTAAEEAVPETLRERVRRERPDVEQEPPGDPEGRLVAPANPDDDGEAIGEWEEEDAGGLSAEEDAVHIRKL